MALKPSPSIRLSESPSHAFVGAFGETLRRSTERNKTMASEGGNNTARQRALLAVQERQKEIEIENTERLKQIKETNRQKWHNNRKKTPLSGSIRQREDSSVERPGGPAKLQAGGSPTRGAGVTKHPSTIPSILRGKPSSNTSARKEKNGLNNANIASRQASRFSQGTKGGNGSGKGARKNKIAQESSNSTPKGASRGVTPTVLFSQGLQPKSPNKRAHKANNNSTGNNDNTIDADDVPAEGGEFAVSYTTECIEGRMESGDRIFGGRRNHDRPKPLEGKRFR